MNERLLQPTEAAQYLAISPKHLTALVRQGDLKSINVGCGTKRPRLRFEIRDLEAFKTERAYQSCQYSSAPSQKSIPMTSGSKVTDFRALLEKRTSEKPSSTARS